MRPDGSRVTTNQLVTMGSVAALTAVFLLLESSAQYLGLNILFPFCIKVF